MSYGKCIGCGKETSFNDDGYGVPQCDDCWKKQEETNNKEEENKK